MVDAEVLPGLLKVDEGLALVRCEPATPAVAGLRGELVAPASELLERFAATLVARPQTQRTYRRACERFVRWLGPLAARRTSPRPMWRTITPTWSRAIGQARRSKRTVRR